MDLLGENRNSTIYVPDKYQEDIQFIKETYAMLLCCLFYIKCYWHL